MIVWLQFLSPMISKPQVFSSNQWHANDSLGQLDVPIRSLVPGEVHAVHASESTSQQLKLEAGSGLQVVCPVAMSIFCIAKVTSPLHEEVPRQEGQQKPEQNIFLEE